MFKFDMSKIDDRALIDIIKSLLALTAADGQTDNKLSIQAADLSFSSIDSINF